MTITSKSYSNQGRKNHDEIFKDCTCDVKSALYNDLGQVKCQYCGKPVSKERADKFIKYNTPIV